MYLTSFGGRDFDYNFHFSLIELQNQGDEHGWGHMPRGWQEAFTIDIPLLGF